MKVSILMPAYNTHQFIERAIQSVCSQTYQDWELIIVDDGSDPPLKNFMYYDQKIKQ